MLGNIWIDYKQNNYDLPILLPIKSVAIKILDSNFCVCEKFDFLQLWLQPVIAYLKKSQQLLCTLQKQVFCFKFEGGAIGFLATLVALHFTPVSDSVSRSFELA